MGVGDEGGDMATKTMERALLSLENQYWQAMKDKDLDGS